jgi:hypothetical protein
MTITFFYIVFQADPDKNRITYWRDGSKTKERMNRDTFLEIAMDVNEGKNYSAIHDACNTYSFYLWDALDMKVIHLSNKIEREEATLYKNSLMSEITKVKFNPNYSSQDAIYNEKNNKNKNNVFSILEELGFEQPSFEMIPLLTTSMSKALETNTLYSKIKQVFTKK